MVMCHSYDVHKAALLLDHGHISCMSHRENRGIAILYFAHARKQSSLRLWTCADHEQNACWPVHVFQPWL